MDEKGTSEAKGNQPDYRIVQVVKDPFIVEKTGKESNYKHVGAIWLGMSKDNKQYLSIRIGNLELVGFPNDKPADKPAEPAVAAAKGQRRL